MRLAVRRYEQRIFGKNALDVSSVINAQMVEENGEQDGDEQRQGEEKGDARDNPPHVETPSRAKPLAAQLTKRDTIKETFWPPKPKLLLRTWSTRFSRAVLGT